MRLFKTIAFFICCLFIAGCDSTPLISDLTFSDNYKCAYFNDKPFNGTAWSDSNKRMSISCENGAVKSVDVYHNNGNIAIKGPAFFELGKFYNDMGLEISIEQFTDEYPQVIMEVISITDEIIPQHNNINH